MEVPLWRRATHVYQIYEKYAGVSNEGLSQWYYRNTTTGELEKTTQYSDGDYFLCGDPTPDLYGGFSTALSFKGFDFSTQFTYSIGGQAYDSGYASLMQPPTANRVGYNYHKDVYKAWTSEILIRIYHVGNSMTYMQHPSHPVS